MNSSQDKRVREIDTLRGLALCGILFVNIVGITGMPTGPGAGADLGHHVYETLLHQRFFPLFSLLFGVSFALFLRAVARQGGHPRLVALARFGFLIPIGLAHQALQPREVLLVYAVVGIVVLLPVSLLPRWTTPTIGGAATAWALATGGGVSLIPGLFVLGLAAAQYGLHRDLDRRGGHAAVVFGACAVLAVALNAWQIHAVTEPSGSPLAATAGVVTAAAYACGLLAALRTRMRRSLAAVLEPLGRTALTNYLAATPLVIAADQVLNLRETPRYGTVVALGVVILTVQATVSVLWLRRFTHGPMEWVWRCLTWWCLLPNRRTAFIGEARNEAGVQSGSTWSR
jgi:uncharacterized membrane protein YeiB